MARKPASTAYHSLKKSIDSVRNRMRREKRAAENAGDHARAKSIHNDWLKLRSAHKALGFGTLANLSDAALVARRSVSKRR